MGESRSIKSIIVDAIRTIMQEDEISDKNLPIDTFDTSCKRKLQLDMYPSHFGVSEEDISKAHRRKQALEDGKIGSERIGKHIIESILRQMPMELEENLSITKNVDVNFEIAGFQLRGTIDLKLNQKESSTEEIAIIRTIAGASTNNIPKNEHLDHLLLYQFGYKKSAGYLIYITRDLGEIMMYKQDYDATNLNKIKRYLTRLKTSHEKKKLANKLKDSSSHPCSYKCKWADYCWNDDAIPPMRYMI